MQVDTIYFEDCLLGMEKIKTGSIDMILCDLPYGTTHNKLDIKIPFDKLWVHYDRIIKDTGVIALFADGFFLAETMMSNPKLWRYNLVWDKVLKTGFLNANRMPLRRHEEICIFYKNLPTFNPQFSEGEPLHGKGKAYKNKELTNNNYGNFLATEDTRKGSTQKYPTSILQFPKAHPSVAKHRTEKPVELLKYLILTYTNDNDVVLDNAIGSGSTAIACIQTNRRFIGFEIDKQYFDISAKRIEEEKCHMKNKN